MALGGDTMALGRSDSMALGGDTESLKPIT